MTTEDRAARLAAIAERHAKATPGPWGLCHHLESAESDASCPCGYRGSIWSGDEELIICEMGASKEHDGNQMQPQAERSAQLADAAMIAGASIDIPWLLAELQSSDTRAKEMAGEIDRLQSIVDALRGSTDEC